jgi:hypothetical protein
MRRDHNHHLAALAGASLAGGTGGGAVKRAKALFLMGLIVALVSAIAMLRSWSSSSEDYKKEEDNGLGTTSDSGLLSSR